MLVMARVIEKEQGDVDRALDMNRQILAIDEGNEQALDALERLYLGKGRFEELLDVYEKKLELTSDGDERIAIQSKIGQLYEDEVKDDKKAIAAYQAILDAAGDEPSALRSLDRVYLRNAMWKELADVLGRQLTIVGPDDDKAAHVELKYRLGQVKEQHLGDVAGRDRRVPRHPRHRCRRTRRRATRSRSSCAATTSRSSPSPASSSRSTSSSASGRRSSASTRSSSRPRRTRCAATSLLLRIGELQRTKLLDAEKAFDAYARAFKEDPSTEAAKEQLEALAALLEDGWARLVKLFEEALAQARTSIQQLAHELATKVARSYEDRLGNSDKAVEFFKQGARDRARRSRRARRARGDLHARREVPRAARDLSPPRRHRERAPTSASSSCSASPRSTRRCSTRPTRRSRPTTRSSARRRTI